MIYALDVSFTSFSRFPSLQYQTQNGVFRGETGEVFIDNHDTQRSNPLLTFKNGGLYTLANVAWKYVEISTVGHQSWPGCHPWDWYIYLHENHKNQPNVGKYTSPMDPMGLFVL